MRKKKRFYGNQFTKHNLKHKKASVLKLSQRVAPKAVILRNVQKSENLRTIRKVDIWNRDEKEDPPNYSQRPGTSKEIPDLNASQSMEDTEHSKGFNWRPYLRKPKFSAAPVSCFKHVAFFNCWDSIVLDVRVEVRSPDCKTCCTFTPCKYWIATVIKVCGYWGLLRYDGFDKLSPHYFNVPDKWVNLCTEKHIHPIGWCQKNKKPLVPPKSLEPKIISWKEFLVETLTGGRTLPPDFTFEIEESSLNTIKKGMKLEVVDKNLISVVRSAIVTDVVGGRLHIKYAETEFEDEGFWCHERSSLIHPVGWAQIIGHALKARPEYGRQSLKKTLYRMFEPNDATWDMFLPVYNPANKRQFKVGMKLEAIDPLNLSTICVATVTKVLRNNYLMIGIDGMMQPNGSDWFCYHASSPCIFPVGFCELHDIKLTPPRGYKGEFKWSEYLKRTKAEAAPVDLFRTDIPDHGFEEGMYLEAVDLMEPRLICVAYVTKVVGRLLKVHFEGWEDDYDQWCDCESPDLFPIGWCDVLGYRLEPPRADNTEDKKKKKVIVKRRKRRNHWSKKVTSGEDSPSMPQNPDTSKSNDGLDSKDSSRANSVILDESSSNSFSEKKNQKTSTKLKNTPKGKSKFSKKVQSSTDTPGSEKANTSTEASGSFREKKNLRGKRINYEESPVVHRIRTPQLRKAKTPSFVTYAEDSSVSSDGE